MVGSLRLRALGVCLSFAVLAACAGGGSNTQGFAGDDGGSGDGSSTTDATGSSSGGHDSGSAGADSGGGADTGSAADTGSGGGSDGASSDGPSSDGQSEASVEGGGGTGMLGATCSTNADCASNACIPVFPGYSVCVTPCASQSDCPSGTGYFCDPTSAGSSTGYCVPHSPAHCLSCASDTDCGSLSETCVQLPGDTAKACHIDCNLAQSAACPPDYSCGSFNLSGTLRYLCEPNATKVCNDAIGGYCDRVSLPQPCARSNTAGSCQGERTCLPAGRFDVCGAQAPQCKTDCSQQDPAGCMESYCASATSSPTNCGACGTICPGYGAANDVVTCTGSPLGCTFGCQGENYDVNNNPADGCEVTHTPQGAHTTSTAAPDGSLPCSDSSSNPNISGSLQSDRVTHTPAITSFVAGNGSAPDVWMVYGSGGLTCLDDYSITLTVNSTNPACYQLLFATDKTNVNCTAAGGSCNVSGGSGSYTDGSDIYFTVQKICSLPFDESAPYTITGHL